MENLNAEQVIKAFEVCRDKDLCNECPYEENIDCLRLREKHAIDLMKSQEQKINDLTAKTEAQDIVIAELRKKLDKANHDADRYARKIEELTVENERLQKYNAVLIEDNHILSSECIPMAKADTVRKMHYEIKERCIKGGIYPAFVARTIDQIAKELLEDGH